MLVKSKWSDVLIKFEPEAAFLYLVPRSFMACSPFIDCSNMYPIANLVLHIQGGAILANKNMAGTTYWGHKGTGALEYRD